MKVDIESLLHERLEPQTARLYADGHFREAAQLAMTQVEIALKEKAGVVETSGTHLVDRLLGDQPGIKLHTPFGEGMRRHAWSLFRAAFVYYRNYATHEGTEFDETTGLRVMILASELLDIIQASRLSFTEIGGVEGLVREQVFQDAASLRRLLPKFDGYLVIDNEVDGLYEDLAALGYDDSHVQALIDVGLIEYSSEPHLPSIEELRLSELPPDEIGSYELTPLGRGVLSKGQGCSSNEARERDR